VKVSVVIDEQPWFGRRSQLDEALLGRRWNNFSAKYGGDPIPIANEKPKLVELGIIKFLPKTRARGVAVKRQNQWPPVRPFDDSVHRSPG
jgi:hypothetical protein